MPWQTIGEKESWNKPDELSLLYPPAPPRTPAGLPVPSVRLKSFRYGQQLVEYLTMWARLTNAPRWQIRHQLRACFPLVAQREGTGFQGGEDAGRLRYEEVDPRALEQLRENLGAALAGKAPAPVPPARLWSLPSRPIQTEEFLVTRGAMPPSRPRTDSGIPVLTETKPSGPTRQLVVQGKPLVQDVLLDPDRAEEPLGKQERALPLRATTKGNAWLLRFEPRKLNLKPNQLRQALVRFQVWDPSSSGRMRVDVRPLRVPGPSAASWDEATATWNRPAVGQRWANGAFDPNSDTEAAIGQTIIAAEDGSDTAEPPVAYEVDITPVVRQWLENPTRNHGVALLPVPDRAVDEGRQTRNQVYGSEFRRPDYGPALIITVTD